MRKVHFIGLAPEITFFRLFDLILFDLEKAFKKSGRKVFLFKIKQRSPGLPSLSNSSVICRQFHQRSTYCFYARRSRKRKKISMT